MNHIAARILILVVFLFGVSWTVYCHVYLTEGHTTSRTIQRLVAACPAIGMAMVLVAVHVFQDAVPGIDRWIVLLLFITALSLGHCVWP